MKYINNVFNMYRKVSIFLIVLLLFFISTGCNKYLNEKPDPGQVIPNELEHLQAMLDNNIPINQSNPLLTEVSADNYYVTTSSWEFELSIGTEGECRSYIWDKDISYLPSWKGPYQGGVYYGNIVLDALTRINVDESNERQWKAVKGTALFYRAFSFERLAQIYCRPYSESAVTDPGIVLKMNTDIYEKSSRVTVKQTYDQIIGDLKVAAELLPEKTQFTMRPCKAAAYGVLARTYLSMRDYTNAGYYADLCLRENNALLDYNSLLPVIFPFPPVPQTNPEVIFYSISIPASLLGSSNTKIDSNLYKSYDVNDLRKTVFFLEGFGSDAGTYSFQGSYAAFSTQVFEGIATDEMYLIRAEVSARAGLKDSAMADLNRLMIKRWRNNGSWVPFVATNAADALIKVLTERRKELLFRGLRWSDLRRLNLEGAGITLNRVIGGVTYTLPPNDLRWVLLIPAEVVSRTGMEQNLR